MKRAACIILTALSVLLLQASVPAHAASPAGAPASGDRGQRRTKYKPGELLVRFRTGASSKDMHAAHARVQAQVAKSYHIVSNLRLVRLPEGTNLLRAARAYRRDRSVLYAEPNYQVHAVTTPDDPQYANGAQWDMNNTGQNGGTADADIDAPEAWGITTGDSSVVIGVIDTGVDYTHPDLTGNMHHLESSCSDGVDNDGNGHVDDCFGINAITGSSDPLDDFGHGTHVSGTIGAKGNNSVGVAGVNWNVGLVACKFLDADGFGFDSDAITCLEYFKDLRDNHGLNLVATNNSWGGGGFSQALSDAIDAHRQSGILFIAAAGNAGSDNDGGGFFPADFFLPNLVSVAATDRNDALADFSNFGKRTVHLGAPGVDVISTLLTSGPLSDPSGYGLLSGTSMASPHVAGVAALVKAKDPSRDWRAIKNLILAGGDNKASVVNTITGKRLNANGALTCSNSTVLSRLRPTGDISSAATGDTVLLAVLHINCAAPAGDVDVTLNPGGTTVTLKDDGAVPDRAAGDGIYSGQFTAGAPGTYTVSITGGEAFTLNVLESYFFQPVVNSYRTISGTNLNFIDDDVTQITPSFPILFGGGSFSSLWVSNNGILSFDSPFSDFFNTPLPAAGPQTLVAPFWTDLFSPSSTQNVFWEETGSTPNRELVIEWRDVSCFFCSDLSFQTVKFQAVFFESKSDILFDYADTSLFGGDHGDFSTIGVQVASLSANQFSFDEPSLDDNKALLWTTTGPDVTNPLPSITSLAPASTTVRADFTLTVNGSNFTSDSVVRWNGSDRSTTFVNGGQLTAQIGAADVSAVGTATVTVFTFAGGNSNPATFTVIGPIINSLVPASASGGGPAFTLTVNGTDFVSGAVVRWNGADRTTTFVNSGQLTATIPAADIAVPGDSIVAVANPGGVTSTGAFFTIADFNLSVSPSSATVSAGQSATYTVLVDASGLFDNAVALTCSLSSPVGTCSLTPASATPGFGNFTSTLTVQTSASAALHSPFTSPLEMPAAAFLFWMPLAAFLGTAPADRRRKANLLFFTVFALLLGYVMLQAGCGGGGGEAPSSPRPRAPRTVTVTVTGQSGTLQHSVTATLVIR